MEKLSRESLEYKIASELISDTVCSYTRQVGLPDIKILKKAIQRTLDALTGANWSSWLEILHDSMDYFGMPSI